MNKYESFRRGLLEKAAFNASSNTAIHVNTWGLSAEFGIPESHVREQLLWLAEQGLISLVAWDGTRERPYNEWPDAESFFANKEGGTLRIKLLSAGGEFLASSPKRPIGFVASR
jgi:hypothetical protein